MISFCLEVDLTYIYRKIAIMKKSTYFLICFISILTFQSCSTVKVLDSWKSDNVSDLKNRNFLVVARSANDQTRLVFENKIIKQIESNGYRVTSSFAKFGNMNPNEKPSESNKGMIKKCLSPRDLTVLY